jgi:hypothetical protein
VPRELADKVEKERTRKKTVVIVITFQISKFFGLSITEET